MPELADLYEQPKGSWGASRSAIEDGRDSAMSYLDEYYTTPENASLVSERLDQLLEPTSEYMLEAQKSSREAREEAGYLESDFNEGVGTATAIDRAYTTAMSDVYTDVFNLDEQNKANRNEYLAAYEASMKAMLAQGELSGAEYEYGLLLKELESTHDDELEYQGKQYEYETLLQDAAHEDEMDRVYLFQANRLANRVITNKNVLQQHYLNAYTDIMTGDLKQWDKYDQLVGLGKQIDEATRAAVDKQNLIIGDQPYSISDIGNLDEYYMGQETDAPFVFSYEDAVKEYGEFVDFTTNIYNQLDAQLGPQMPAGHTLLTVDLITDPANLNESVVPENPLIVVSRMTQLAVDAYKTIHGMGRRTYDKELVGTLWYLNKDLLHHEEKFEKGIEVEYETFYQALLNPTPIPDLEKDYANLDGFMESEALRNYNSYCLPNPNCSMTMDDYRVHMKAIYKYDQQVSCYEQGLVPIRGRNSVTCKPPGWDAYLSKEPFASTYVAKNWEREK